MTSRKTRKVGCRSRSKGTGKTKQFNLVGDLSREDDVSVRE